MRGALMLLLCMACGEEGETDMMRGLTGIPRGGAAPESWGQERVFSPGSLPTAASGGATLLTLPPRPDWRTPRVQTLIAGVTIEEIDAVANDYHLRWILQSGTGGARTEVQFDALGFTRVALPIEQARISLGYEAYAGGGVPGDRISAFAYIGDFSVGVLPPGPTYTEYFDPAAATFQRFNLPVGATRFRMSGNENTLAAVSPFKITTTVTARNLPQVLATWAGLGAAPGDPSLYALHYTGDFIPLPAGTNVVEVDNQSAAQIQGRLIFGLDL